MKPSLLASVLLCGLFSVLFIPHTFAEEVPYEVFKTEMKESVTVRDGRLLFYNPENDQWKITSNDGMTGKIGGSMEILTSGTFVELESITYTLQFHNVGKLKGEDYADAELSITYDVGEAYKIGLKSGEEIINEGGAYYQQLLEKDDAQQIIGHIENQVRDGVLDGEKGRKKIPLESPDLPSKTLKLSFSGGPFGRFGMKPEDIKDGVIVMGEITDLATNIVLKAGGGSEENYYQQNMYHLQPSGARQVIIPIKGDGLEKWMAILQDDMGECSDPENPTKDSGIRFSDIWGEVELAACNGIMDEEWYLPELGDVLHVEDHIRTGLDSGAVLSLTDMTTFKMRPNTEIVLSDPPQSESKIRLVAGKVWTNLKRMAEGKDLKIEMSQAAAGIKGTILVTSDDGESSTLKVIEGEVEFTNRQTGASVLIKQGEAIEAKGNQVSSVTTFDVDQEKKNWEDMQNTEYVETAVFDTPEPTEPEVTETKTQSENTERAVNESQSEKSNTWIWGLVLLFVVVGGFVIIKKK